MTVKLLRDWNGMDANTIVTLDRGTEAALLGNYTASSDLNGGTPFLPNAVNVATTASALQNLNNGGLPVPTRSNRTVLVGDSMVGREWNDTSVQKATTGYGWIAQANAILGNPLTIVSNYGVTGITCPQILATMSDAEETARTCGFVVVSCGTNDIFADGTTSDELIPIMQSIFYRLLNTGAIVIWLNLTPRTFVNASQVAYQLNVNAFFKSWALTQKNFLVFDAASVIVNPTSTQFAPTSGYLDGSVHFNNSGASLVGAAFASFINSFLVPSTANLVSSAADTYTVDPSSCQVWSNPLNSGSVASPGAQFTATGGGTLPTGALPTGVQVDHAVNSAGTCVASIVSRSDGIGSNVRMVIGGGTVAGANDRWTLRNLTNITTGVSPGDWIELEMSVLISAQLNLSGIVCFLQTQVDGGTVTYSYALRHDSTADVTYQSGFNGAKLIRTRPLQLTAGTSVTALQWRVEPRFTTAAGTATIEVGRVSIRNLTRLGVM